MKFKFIYLASMLAFGFTTLFSFSSGPTGSMGDRTGRTGSSCNQCHSATSSFSVSTSLQITDANQNLITNGEYIPGDTYTLSFTVSATGSPNSYGLQAVIVDSLTQAQAGSLANASTGVGGTGSNAKITNNGGRSYLEQSARNANGVFNVEWTAPPAGTGTVEMYVAGLAVNGGGSSGDDLGNFTFSLKEAVASNVNSIANTLNYNVYPNPVINKQVFVEGINGQANLTITDLSGRIIMSQINQLQDGQAIQLPQDISAGLYLISIVHDGKQNSQKLFVQ